MTTTRFCGRIWATTSSPRPSRMRWRGITSSRLCRLRTLAANCRFCSATTRCATTSSALPQNWALSRRHVARRTSMWMPACSATTPWWTGHKAPTCRSSFSKCPPPSWISTCPRSPPWSSGISSSPSWTAPFARLTSTGAARWLEATPGSIRTPKLWICWRRRSSAPAWPGDSAARPSSGRRSTPWRRPSEMARRRSWSESAAAASFVGEASRA
mmetsp:Transcript_41558/g.120401  ORF Transcript_41558/g.120401 Transcript_41558/m.120401 type:complete len:214 (-) Transcript_41558:71-712(-)